MSIWTRTYLNPWTVVTGSYKKARAVPDRQKNQEHYLCPPMHARTDESARRRRDRVVGSTVLSKSTPSVYLALTSVCCGKETCRSKQGTQLDTSPCGEYNMIGTRIDQLPRQLGLTEIFIFGETTHARVSQEGLKGMGLDV